MKKSNHPAMAELYEIIKIEDWSTFCPEKIRLEKLNSWIRNWVEDLEYKQDVVDEKYLTSEYMDLIKYKLTETLAEELSDNCTVYKTDRKTVKANMIALRRIGKKESR